MSGEACDCSSFPSPGEEMVHQLHKEPFTQCGWRPSLSELIKACGDGFRMLERHPVTGLWLTHKSHDIEVWSMQVGKELKYGTPEEAVARLWLALQRK